MELMADVMTVVDWRERQAATCRARAEAIDVHLNSIHLLDP